MLKERSPQDSAFVPLSHGGSSKTASRRLASVRSKHQRTSTTSSSSHKRLWALTDTLRQGPQQFKDMGGLCPTNLRATLPSSRLGAQILVEDALEKVCCRTVSD